MNKHEYISKITEIVAEKGSCDRARVGAVFVNQDYEILATGYNSSPKGFETCDDAGHFLKGSHCVRTTHAEMNAITQAANRGISLDNSIVYVTHNPCNICTKLLINVGVSKVLYKSFYKDKQTILWLKAAGIEVRTWEEEEKMLSSQKREKIAVPESDENG